MFYNLSDVIRKCSLCLRNDSVNSAVSLAEREWRQLETFLKVTIVALGRVYNVLFVISSVKTSDRDFKVHRAI